MAKIKNGKRAPRELERAGSLCVAYANLSAVGRDDRRRDRRVPLSEPLTSYDRLARWAERMGVMGSETARRLVQAATERPEDSAAALARATGLSSALLRLFTAVALETEPRAEDLATLNRSLRKRDVFPEAGAFRRGWIADDEALDRLLWPLAHSAAELLASARLRRVRQCASAGCTRLFVYSNARRRWCDENTCGNRAKNRRYNNMWRRAHEKSAAKTYDQLREDSERRAEEARKSSKENAKKHAELRALLQEINAEGGEPSNAES